MPQVSLPFLAAVGNPSSHFDVCVQTALAVAKAARVRAGGETGGGSHTVGRTQGVANGRAGRLHGMPGQRVQPGRARAFTW